MTLLHKILENETSNNTSSSNYDEIVHNRLNTTMTTRAASRGQLTTVTHCYKRGI